MAHLTRQEHKKEELTEPRPEEPEASRRPAHWASVPFDPARWPFFYGWVIVVAATVGALMSIPGQTIGVGIFREDVGRALGLSEVAVSLAYMLGTLGSSLALPFAGRLLDDLGARVMVVVSSVGLAMGVLVLSRADRLATAVSSSAVVAMVVITACFLLLRFFGQGCLTLISRVTIGKWFNHRRGRAVAIFGLFVAFGFYGSPLLLNRMVEVLGWRGAAVTLAVVVGLAMPVIGWIFYRDSPERCGLVMDGVTDPEWHRRMGERFPAIRHEFTRKEAMRTRAFWIFSLGMAAPSLIGTAAMFLITSIGSEMGLDRQASYAVFLPMACVVVAANFAGSWLSDRVRLKYLLMVMTAGQVLGLFGLMNLNDFAGRALFAVGHGTAAGLFGVLGAVSWPRFFGRRHLGAISGVNFSITVIASAVGPLFFSSMQRLTGDFRTVCLVMVALPTAVFIAAFTAGNPQEGTKDAAADGCPVTAEHDGR